MFDVSGQAYRGEPNYVTVQESSNHFKIYRASEEVPPCSVTCMYCGISLKGSSWNMR